MKLSIGIEEDEEITPRLARVKRGLKPGGKARLHALIGRRMVEVTRNHLRKIAPDYHKTARSLGAQPTGHLTRGLLGIRPALLQDDVELFIPIPGISRAFRPLTIMPRTGKYLTIPARAESYGERARSFSDLRFIPLKKGAVPVLGRVVKGEDEEGKTTRELQVFYWLKTKVELEQDRGLMPTDGELLDAAEQGADDYLQEELFNARTRAA